MKTYNFFIVEIESVSQDTITTDSGLELYIDTRFNEFEHRTQHGKVIAAPFKWDHGVEVGDTLYFHHRVVLNEGQPLTGYDNHYLVGYHPSDAIESQAIAFKSQKTGEVKVLSGWTLIEQIQEERDDFPSDLIEMVKLEEKPITKGRIVFDSEGTKELGLKIGDIVGFQKNRDYDLKVDDTSYGRIRTKDLLYVEEHND